MDLIAMRICNVSYVWVVWDKLFYMKIWYPCSTSIQTIQPEDVNFNFLSLSTVSLADCPLWNVPSAVVISAFTDTVLSSRLAVVHRSLWYYVENCPFLYFYFVIFFLIKKKRERFLKKYRKHIFWRKNVECKK